MQSSDSGSSDEDSDQRSSEQSRVHCRLLGLGKNSGVKRSWTEARPASDDGDYDEWGQPIIWSLEVDELHEQVKQLKQENAALRAQLAQLTSAVGADGS